MSNSGEPWALVGFRDWLDHWIEMDHPNPELHRDVLFWILELRNDPMPPRSGPVPFPTYDDEPPPIHDFWFAISPYGSTPQHRVTCTYRIRWAEHCLSCHGIAELREPIDI